MRRQSEGKRNGNEQPPLHTGFEEHDAYNNGRFTIKSKIQEESESDQRLIRGAAEDSVEAPRYLSRNETHN